jgi:[acyl-carrier-protein] S-malonyltransferase
MKAFVFPGQGSQYAGMGLELNALYPEARAVFEEADDALGFALSRLCFEGPDDELVLTENTQPALLATSIATYRVLESRGIQPDFVAGHSLGEYSALVAADALKLSDAVRLVRQRGRFMQEAVPVGVGAMSAVIGLDLGVVAAACAEAAQGQVVAAANDNSPGQIVIAGHREAVDRAGEIAKEKGARLVKPLAVSAPFHCSLMKPAEDRLRVELDKTEFQDLSFPLVNNVEAKAVSSGEEARDGLARQVCAMVCWTGSVRRLTELGVDTVVEVGPGKVLSGLIRRTEKGLVLSNVENGKQVEEHVQS